MIALLLVLGCGGSPPPVSTSLIPQSPEALEIEAVIAAWNERDDLPAMNATKLRALRILDARTDAEYGAVCPPSGECLIHRYPRFMGEATAIVVISPAQRSPGSRLSLIRHGAVHRALEVAGISDPVHRDRRAWPYHCGQDVACRAPTVEERARTIANTR